MCDLHEFELLKTFTELSKVLRTDNLDLVMKKEALNENRLHRGSDKPCAVRGTLRFLKKEKFH